MCPGERPNVVFVIADQHRWDFIGGAGNGYTSTPVLDQMARAGVRFGSAYCTSPLCCPSRAAIASGRYGTNTGCFTNLHELPPGTPSFVSQFRESGYHTCAIGKTHMEIHAYDSDLLSAGHLAYMNSLGWDEVCEISGNVMLKTGIRCAYSEFLRQNGMFDEVLGFYRNWHYFMDAGRRGDHSFVPHEWPFAPEYQETAFVGDRTVNWLRSWDGDRPFLLHVGFAGPHSPIEPLPEFMDLYRDREELLPWGAGETLEWALEGRRGYRAMIGQIDHQVGRVLACLEEKGWLEDTIVVYTADHGEMAGDHGRFGKTCFYGPSVRVPLLFAGPGIEPGPESSALVELVDVGKTLCELCAVEPHALDQGQSLAPVLCDHRDGLEVVRDTVYAEMGCDKMLCDGRYKLMWGDPVGDMRKLGRLHLDKPVNIPPSPSRLYDLETDPCELEDISQDPANQGLVLSMVEKLLTRLNRNSQTQPFKSRGEYRPLL